VYGVNLLIIFESPKTMVFYHLKKFFEDFSGYADRLHPAYLTLQCQTKGSMGERLLSACRFQRKKPALC
ncbi:MAG: hypothetical protein K2H63_10165, partial [Paramuribaculum sp.]|nr:hypothetical protein [Paramuribaculum sp.]